MTFIVTSSLLLPNGAPISALSESFANFVKVVRDSMVAGGWVDTEAFGSINTGSVKPPRGGNTIFYDTPYTGYGGFNVFRMNDTLHSQGYPVYIRFDYGSPLNGGVYGIQLTLGFTHDESGSVGGYSRGLNNTFDFNMVINTNSGTSGSLYDHRFCIISGSDMGMLLANNLAGGGAAFAFVERTKDGNGNNTNEGVVVGTYANANDFVRQSYLLYSQTASGQMPVAETYFNVVYGQQTVARADEKLPIFPIIPMVSYGPHNPLRMVGFVKSGDLPLNDTYEIMIYNTASMYFASENSALGDYRIYGNDSFSGATTMRLMMRQE